MAQNEKFNLDRELDKIEAKLPYLDDIKTWEAYIGDENLKG